MLFNYHTHTKRCGHAGGEDREYIENAIAGGLQTLGFSDHAPYPFPNGHVSYHRMSTDALFEYAESIRALAKEYEKDIRILCGFELEYYPDYHEEEMQFLRQVAPDYLILGQHFIHSEWNSPHVINKSDEQLLRTYVTQVIAGLATGDFLYLAHPDMVGWSVPKDVAVREYERLCQFAKKKDIPLEINCLGMAEKRCYPTRDFFEIASQIGNRVIIGIDAHHPSTLADKEQTSEALAFAQDLGLQLIEKPLL